ncbi:glycerophosphodiester phosphodiesterase family protein [Olivibacter sp. CPCC 100613]|uniref:glycerophosphodiester phosphodiesterase family protein n=1 Tax=Olivibacter sp. CPCC 100613 TaxID=3079931 RepID=UPI002FF6A3B6
MKKQFFLMTAICLFTFMQSTYAQFNKNIVIAHRGAWKQANLPENSLASLNHASELGCHGSEFDVYLTKDNILVVNHNKDFYGIDIETATYQELLAKKHPNGESIPTVEAYLKEGMKQKKTKLIYELKPSKLGKERVLKAAEMSVALVKKLGAEKWVDYITFDRDAGKHLAKLAPKAEVAYLNGDLSPAEAKADGFKGIDYHYDVFKKNPSWIQDAHKLGLTVNVWTVNDAVEMKNLLDQKVEYITTNEPELLFDILGKK